jgi:ribosomal-protein-serine acetyltransferase
MHWSIDIDDDIKLELLDDGHAEELFRLIADGRATLDPWLPWVRGTTRPEDTSRFIERARSRWA